VTKIEICDSNCIHNQGGMCTLSMVEIVDGQCGSYLEKEAES